jgi:hypothetical protein
MVVFAGAAHVVLIQFLDDGIEFWGKAQRNR